MTSSLPSCPRIYPGGTLVLPPWQIEDATGNPAAPASLTALTYTIRRVADQSAVGTASRDGLGGGSGANGISLNSAGILIHTIGPADNTPLVAGATELRRVEYTLTFTGGAVVVVRVEYYVRALEY